MIIYIHILSHLSVWKYLIGFEILENKNNCSTWSLCCSYIDTFSLSYSSPRKTNKLLANINYTVTQGHHNWGGLPCTERIHYRRLDAIKSQHLKKAPKALGLGRMLSMPLAVSLWDKSVFSVWARLTRYFLPLTISGSCSGSQFEAEKERIGNLLWQISWQQPSSDG